MYFITISGGREHPWYVIMSITRYEGGDPVLVISSLTQIASKLVSRLRRLLGQSIAGYGIFARDGYDLKSMVFIFSTSVMSKSLFGATSRFEGGIWSSI